MKPKDLRGWLTRNELSQVELARFLNVSHITVNRWASGTRAIPPHMWLALAHLEAIPPSAREDYCRAGHKTPGRIRGDYAVVRKRDRLRIPRTGELKAGQG